MLEEFKTRISEKTAGYFLLILMACTIVFHGFVLLGIVPYNIVWGGQLESVEEMYMMESVSIGLTLFMAWMVAVRIEVLHAKFPALLSQFIFGGMALLFLLNTIGNLFAVNRLETLLFTPLTLLSTIACFRLALW
jgi:hypothetical protein